MLFSFTDRDKDLGVAKSILVYYLNKEQLKDLFRELGLADVTLQNHFKDCSLMAYAEDLLHAWISGRDNVLNHPNYPDGATWVNLKKALTLLGHKGTAGRI